MAHHILDAVFLIYVLLVLPRAAFRSARILQGRALRAGAAPGPVPPREQILLSTILSLTILGVLSWTTARLDDRELLAYGAIGSRELLAGAGVLALHFALRSALIAWRTAEERQNLPSSAWMPRTPRQWGLYVITCLLAGLVEEATYRGVLVWIVAPYLGLLPAVLLSALLFAAAHVAQRWKAAVIVFAMALSQHWLVAFTGTLVIAMVLHAFYDLAAGLLRARRLAREARQAGGNQDVMA